jgi:hypothetical protein
MDPAIIDAFFNTIAGQEYLRNKLLPTLEECLDFDEYLAKCRHCGSESDGFDEETLDVIFETIKIKFALRLKRLGTN